MLRIQRRTLLAGTVGLLVAGCQLPGGARLSKIDESPLPKLAWAPSWTHEATPMTELLEANLVGDVLLLHGDGGRPFTGNLLAVSAKNGAKVWDVKSVEAQLARRPGITTLFSTETITTDQGPDALVINQTYLTPCPDGKSLCKASDTSATAGRGVVGISAVDGVVRWATEVLASVPNDHPDASRLKDETVEIVGADPRHVVINSGNLEAVQSDAVPQAGQEMRTTMLDATKGKELWTVPDVLAFALAGDVVLAQVPQGSPGERRNGKTLIALDAATGKELWSTRDRDTATGRWLGGAEGIAALLYIDSEDDYGSAVLVNSRTGNAIAENLKTGQFTAGRDSADRLLAVWLSLDSHHIGSYSTGGEAMIGANELEDSVDWIHAVVGGYIWTIERSADSQRSRAIDRSGNVCSDWIDGEVRAVDDQHLVVSMGKSGFDVFTLR